MPTFSRARRRAAIAPALAVGLAISACELARAQSCSLQPLIVPVGSATFGANGAPDLQPSYWPTVGAHFELRVSHAKPSSIGWVGIGTGAAPLPLPAFGAVLHTGVPLLVQGFALDSIGLSPPVFALPALPLSLCGNSVVTQAAVLDAQAPGGIAFTRAQQLRFGAPTQKLLYPTQDWPVGVLPRDLVVADLDLDGLPDIAATGGGGIFQPPGIVVIGFATGDGEYVVPAAYGAGYGPRSIDAADFDADGRLDLSVCNDASSTVSIYRNLGAHAFAQPQFLGTPDALRWHAVGDLDADGVLDIMTAHASFSNALAVLRGVTPGTFAPYFTVPASLDCVDRIELADVDQNGLPDVAVAGCTATLPILRATGNFQYASAFLSVQGAPTGLCAADLNADGCPDLAATTSSSYTHVFHGVPGGAPVFAQAISGAAAPYGVASGDIDGDGSLDLAIASSSQHSVVLVRNAGALGHVPLTTVVVGSMPMDVRLADLDGDGALDVATANANGASLSTSLAIAPAEFSKSSRFSINAEARGFGVGHVNLDARTDILVTHSLLNASQQEIGGTLVLYTCTGPGAFAKSTVPGTTLIGPRKPLVADVDADGRTDVVVPSRYTQHLSLLRGQPSGALGPETQVPILAGAVEVEAGDMNLDGWPDLVTAQTNGTGVLLGSASGSFGVPLVHGFGPLGWPFHLQLGDVDLDGDLDVLVPGPASIYLGNGDGTLAPQMPSGAPGGGSNGALVDLDLDGLLDLATNSYGISAVAVQPGMGGGLFGPHVWHATAESPGELVIHDIDFDGAIDLVALHVNRGSLSVLFAVAVGVGPSTHLLSAPAKPMAVEFGDFDQDGLADIATLDMGNYVQLLYHR